MKLSQLDERFEADADRITYLVGKWWFTSLSLVLLACWVCYGAFVLAPTVPGWFTSQQWNFPLNTITTVGEWFCEGLILAAANRVQRRADAQVRHLQDVLDAVNDHVNWEVENAKATAQLWDERLAAVAALHSGKQSEGESLCPKST